MGDEAKPVTVTVFLLNSLLLMKCFLFGNETLPPPNSDTCPAFEI